MSHIGKNASYYTLIIKKRGENVEGRVGITRNGISIFVEHLPGRKKPCLTVQKGNCIHKVASFNSERNADWFLDWARELFGESNKEAGHE